MKKALMLSIALVIAAMATGAFAWDYVKVKCKSPEAQKLADEEYNLLVGDLSDQNMLKAMELMEKATKIEPDNDLLWIEYAGNCFDYADRLPKKTADERKKRLAIFDKGMDAAKKSLALRESAGGHFWLAVNMAAGGEMKGVMNSLWMFPTLRKEIDRTKAMDPNYQHGGHARFWSEVVARVPDIALKAVGLDAAEPGRDIEAQVKKDPNFFENRVYLAVYYRRVKREAESFSQLDYVLKNDPNAHPDVVYRSQNRRWQVMARNYWKEWTGKEFPNK